MHHLMIAAALAVGTPCAILFGASPDRIGRKPIMLAGFPSGPRINYSMTVLLVVPGDLSCEHPAASSAGEPA
jgi:MFS family permease